MRKVSARQIHRIDRAAAKMPIQSSKEVFEAAGASGVPWTSRCRILQRLAVMHKPSIQPPLTNAHKQKRLQWAQKYMKTNFLTVLFTDECRTILDGPDGCSSGWLMDIRGHKRRETHGVQLRDWIFTRTKERITRMTENLHQSQWLFYLSPLTEAEGIYAYASSQQLAN